MKEQVRPPPALGFTGFLVFTIEEFFSSFNRGENSLTS